MSKTAAAVTKHKSVIGVILEKRKRMCQYIQILEMRTQFFFFCFTQPLTFLSQPLIQIDFDRFDLINKELKVTSNQIKAKTPKI